MKFYGVLFASLFSVQLQAASGEVCGHVVDYAAEQNTFKFAAGDAVLDLEPTDGASLNLLSGSFQSGETVCISADFSESPVLVAPGTIRAEQKMTHKVCGEVAVYSETENAYSFLAGDAEFWLEPVDGAALNKLDSLVESGESACVAASFKESRVFVNFSQIQ